MGGAGCLTSDGSRSPWCKICMGGCTGCMGVCVGDWRGAAWCGSKDHWVLLQLGSRVMVNYEMGEKPNLICPATPAADGPRGGRRQSSSSEQMARTDNGDKLQALEALQCDKKWLSRGPARAGGFSLPRERRAHGAEQHYLHHAAR